MVNYLADALFTVVRFHFCFFTLSIFNQNIRSKHGETAYN